MKIFLVKPGGIDFWFPHPPVNLVYLAGNLRNSFSDIDTRVIDLNLRKFNKEYLKKLIMLDHPDFVGITGLTPDFEEMREIAGLTKSVDPEIITIAGGHHATVEPETLIADNAIDYVIRGEGESSLVELIKCIREKKSFDHVSGLTYRLKGDVVSNGTVLIDNLDNCSYQTWDLIDFNDYPNSFTNPSHKIIPLIGSLVNWLVLLAGIGAIKHVMVRMYLATSD